MQKNIFEILVKTFVGLFWTILELTRPYYSQALTTYTVGLN